jgi:hypothetical protein
MPVLQFVQHVSQHFKQAFAAHAAGNQPAVFVVYGIPVYLFVFQEAVLLVDNLPEGLKVSLRRIGNFVFADATAQQRKHGNQNHYIFQKPYHLVILHLSLRFFISFSCFSINTAPSRNPP